MDLFLDICQGLGLATAAGIRPFLPAIVAGIYATVDWGVDFEGTAFEFLEHPVWLVAIAVLLLVSLLWRRAGESDAAEAAVGGVGLAVGALLFAGTLADRGHDSAGWIALGIVGGMLAALVGQAAYRDLVGRAGARLDPQARRALPLWFDGVGLVLAALSVVLPPVSLLALPFLAWLLLGGRRREGGRYAGLRVLR